ncbi:MAG: hypothetical protein WBG29_01540 [Candidatus Acidiferrales bacterium]
MDMEIVSGREALICRGNEVEGPICEQRLWTAVLVQALEDWRGDRIRTRREAEKFLFEDHKDFETVCAGAGIDPSSFRARLRRLNSAGTAPQPVQLAA